MVSSTEPRLRAERRELLLSPLAAKAQFSRGRARAEEPCPIRTDFQRDRDRIVHSKAFRRLKHKTQVFIAPLGDHYVTRLTHTIELAQIARVIARGLNLNEDLTEAIALAHDLGHPPFGHAGEDALDKIAPGGFRHNHQSLRVVDLLEKDGQGLNLMWETRESIPKHSKPRESVTGTGWGIASTLEGQVCKIADAVAYLNHDIGDAVRAGILRESDLPSVAIDVLGRRHSARVDTLVRDIIAASWTVCRSDEECIDQTRPAYESLRAEMDCAAESGRVTVRMTERVRDAVDVLRDFMFSNVYINSDAKEDVGRATEMLRLLFEHFRAHPADMPAEFAANPRGEPIERVVLDYIAGMTDRYALNVFQRIYFPRLWSVLS
ncbi:MAG: deoxyguanosinetriphosphate triphosphohydrolase [Chloroflexota bacterium]|nr:MAG: deoxyguanosinetriphosphate triphosphohydrolase [Chloroflexota bacterium]